MNVQISPVATDDEVAAIVAAIEVLWPKPAMVGSESALRKPTWRFSNRWWVKPLVTRRERPHR